MILGMAIYPFEEENLRNPAYAAMPADYFQAAGDGKKL